MLPGQARIITMYLNYVNNFLSITRFAEYYGLTEKQAVDVYNYGKQLANN